MGNSDEATTSDGDLWTPWSDPADTIHLHTLCKYYPLDPLDEPDEPPWKADETEPHGGEETPLAYLYGRPRQVLRHVPISLLVTTMLLAAFQFLAAPLSGSSVSEVTTFLSSLIPLLVVIAVLFIAVRNGDGWHEKLGVGGKMFILFVYLIGALWLLFLDMRKADVLDSLVGTLPSDLVPWFVGGSLLVLVGLFLLAIDSGIIESYNDEHVVITLGKAFLFFIILLWLVFGTTYTVYANSPLAENPSVLDENLFGSGYTLMLFLGGLLVYDGMLRTENTFWWLGHKRIVGNRQAYEQFRDELAQTLRGADTHLRWGTPYAFALLFAAPFFLLELLPAISDTGSPWYAIYGFALNFFIVLVAFQFLVLIKYFHLLIRDSRSYPSGKIDLTYYPFHHDGRGGFRDLGKFATRVNVLLILGGLYMAYHLYTSPPLAIGSVGPLLAYTIATGSWLYYSFWMIHKKMVAERERYMRNANPDTLAVRVDRWTDLRQAPVWPLSIRELVSLITANLVPFVLLLRYIFVSG